MTTRLADGSPIGMTANSFTSVSLEPPIVSICVDVASALHDTLTRAERFAINILARGQEEVSRAFASGNDRQFHAHQWGQRPSSLPALQGAVAHIECRHHTAVRAGDHSIILGLVTGGVIGDGPPLLFYQGRYHGLGSA